MRKMQFGLFGSARVKRGEDDPDSIQGYQNWIEFNVEAEALGFHSIFTVEHHFTGLGQVSASINLLTYLAAKTTTLRLGTAVTTLPWHNPILLAEQAATLDLLSNGRFDFGVGKGYRFNEFNSFGIDMENADAMYMESLGLIIKAWTSDERWSHKGEFWCYNDIIVEPPTIQKPHPPVWFAAGREEPIKAAANWGANLLIDQYCPVSEVISRADIFRKEQKRCGREIKPHQIAVARALYIAKDQDEKMAVIERRLNARGNADKLAQKPDGNNKASIMSFRGAEEALEGALIGTLDEILARLDVLEKGGIDYLLLTNAGNGMDDLRVISKECF
jgi:alkanesulfonate monooxygenase SsuD/methylene tetrahydromethanopterin reductase-like flavin-dependent oxidoreductase (luciferase family)